MTLARCETVATPITAAVSAGGGDPSKPHEVNGCGGGDYAGATVYSTM